MSFKMVLCSRCIIADGYSKFFCTKYVFDELIDSDSLSISLVLDTIKSMLYGILWHGL